MPSESYSPASGEALKCSQPRDFAPVTFLALGSSALKASFCGNEVAWIWTALYTVADDLLQRLDDMARDTGQSRSGLIKVGINRVLRDGV